MRKKKWIILISIPLVLICSTIYYAILCRDYPELIISQEQFYGEENQNLKDFEVEAGEITSRSSDPWVTCILQDNINIKVIELDIDGVERRDLFAEIFDMESWESNGFRIHNGRNLCFYTDEQGLQKNSLRFDLVEEQNIVLNVKEVIINSRYGIFYDTVIHFLPMLCGIFLIEIILFVLCDIQKSDDTKTEKIFLKLWLGLQVFVLIATFYGATWTNIDDEEKRWIWIICLTEIFLSVIAVWRKKKCSVTKSRLLDQVEALSFIIICFGQLEILSGICFNFQNVISACWNFILIWFVYAFLCMVFGNRKLTFYIMNFFVVILGIANHYFYQFRAKPLELSDIVLAETALTVVKNYEYKIDIELFLFVIIEVCILFYIRGIRQEKKIDKRQRWAYLIEVFLIFLCVIEYTPEVSYWNMVYSTREHGYLNSFIAYARNDMKQNKPQNYSTKQVTQILEQYEDEMHQEVDPVNIIVIMDEAFSDLPNTYGFETNIDGMPFIHSLEKNTIKGKMTVSVFGGSTANTEWEFLTGNTMAFLNSGVVPYMQYVKRNQASLARELSNMGYQTMAFHPCAAGNYNRDKVYTYMGMDKFISEADTLKYSDYLRYMMSDESDFLNVIDMYENRTEGQPFFLFNVTMQNHGGYNSNESDVEVTVQPKDLELQYSQLQEYLSLIKETDSAFEKLVTYFSKVDEKTIILLFGDHQPGLDEIIYRALDADLYKDTVTIEERQKMYMVPFVLWANYDVEEENDVLISPGFLRAKLLEVAELPMSRYDQFLLNCNKKYGAINLLGYYDEDGRLNDWGDASNEELLMEYRMLQYADMFDRKMKNEFEK